MSRSSKRSRASSHLVLGGLAVVAVVATGSILWLAAAGDEPHRASDSQPGNVATREDDPFAGGDVFEGMVTGAAVSPGTVTGTGVYDYDCFPVDADNPTMTRCDAGIETEEYGVLNFNYVHDMLEQPCIAPGDRVEVQVLDADGEAEVRRGSSPVHP